MTLTAMITAALATITTLDDQRDALGTLFAQVPGVTRCFARRPGAIQPAQLPAVVLNPAPGARYGQEYAGHLRIDRDWTATVYVCAAQSGLDFDAEAAAEPFLDSLPVMLTLCPVIRLDDGRGFSVTPVGNGSIQQVAHADVTYVTVEQRFTTEAQGLFGRYSP